MIPGSSADEDRRDMERLTGGDEAGLNALMDRHGPGLFHFLIRMIGDESDAEERKNRL